MNLPDFISSSYFFLLLSDQDYYLKEYNRMDDREEYGISPGDFVLSHPELVEKDCQEWWDNSDEIQRKNIITLAITKIKNDMEKLKQLKHAADMYFDR